MVDTAGCGTDWTWDAKKRSQGGFLGSDDSVLSASLCAESLRSAITTRILSFLFLSFYYFFNFICSSLGENNINSALGCNILSNFKNQ